MLFLSRFGPRFPAVSKAYEASLRAAAKEIGKDLGIDNILHEGVYTCLGGPNFETVAELSAMKMLGIDAVGELIINNIQHYESVCFYNTGTKSSRCIVIMW
jgi:purine-nucleoside phosphorylase